MNLSYLNDLPFQDKIKEAWREWKTHMSRYPDIVHWWNQYAKRMIKHLFTRKGTERNNYRIKMENLYYTAIYDVLQEPDQHTSKTLAMRRLKAKTIRLNSIHRQWLLVDTGEQDRIMSEETFFHHLLKTRKRQDRRLIKQIYEDNGTLQTSSMSTMKVFSTWFHAKFQPIQIDERSVSQLWNTNRLA